MYYEQSVIQSEINDSPFDKPRPYDKRSMIMASLATMQSGELLWWESEIFPGKVDHADTDSEVFHIFLSTN